MQLIDKEKEDSGSQTPFMAENKHRNNSNQSKSREETREI